MSNATPAGWSRPMGAACPVLPFRVAAAATVLLMLVQPLVLNAQDTARTKGETSTDSVRAHRVDTIRVRARMDALIGRASSASEGRVSAVDLRRRPVTRDAEVLEGVPGLIVTQHSGEGKANQYFVRGFNLDHGTDFQTRVEGMPINMPTHGHGQGWTDLNFLIPELIDGLTYRLGVSHAEVGDFGSAGSAELQIVRRLARPFASVEAGGYGLARVATGLSHEVGDGDLLLALETKGYDGPWERPEGLRKRSAVARFSRDRGRSRFSILAMSYANGWNSTDQIAERAVKSGVVSRFGQLDTTNGGTSQRHSLSARWQRVGNVSVQSVDLFAIRSQLALHSNFTYFLDDPVRGDQFSQTDGRTVLGGRATHTQALQFADASHELSLGTELRVDEIGELGLHRTSNAVRTGTVRQDQVRQLGAGSYVQLSSRWRPWLRTVTGVRGDLYDAVVQSDVPLNSGRRTAVIASPKGSLIITPNTWSEFYVSGGFGFHSNDARGATISIDPVTGRPARRVHPLVQSRGGEIGMRVEAASGLRSSLTVWTLDIASELLFAGDAGATDAAEASRRRGITITGFHRPYASLTLDADLSVAHARFRNVAPGFDRIPGALERVFAAGLSWEPARKMSVSTRLRHIGAYPLVEANSVRSGSATLLNSSATLKLRAGLRAELTVLNLLDRRPNEIAYFYASRLPGEGVNGVEDVHSHAAAPRQFRIAMKWGH
jgi:hypothetical protein